jgi:hypothetical protein
MVIRVFFPWAMFFHRPSPQTPSDPGRGLFFSIASCSTISGPQIGLTLKGRTYCMFP